MSGKERKFNPESQSGKGPESDKEGHQEAFPNNEALWAEVNAQEIRTDEEIRREKQAAQESIADTAFGPAADFAVKVGNLAPAELRPFLERLGDVLGQAPDTDQMRQGREAAQNALKQLGESDL